MAVPVDLTTLPGLELLLVPGRVEALNQGCCGEGGNESHDDEDGEGFSGEDLSLKTDVLEYMLAGCIANVDMKQQPHDNELGRDCTYEDDQFHKSFATH